MSDEESTTVKTVGNEIYFFGEVSEKSAVELNTLLRKMERQSLSHIVLYIHSTGGDTYAGFSVMDHIQALTVPVHTVADGLCGSAATLILLAGTKRYMKKNARVLIHQVSSSSETLKHADLKDEMLHISALMKQMVDVYTQCTKIPRNKMKQMMRRDIYLNLEQCMRYSIVDDVFSSRI